MENTFLLEKLSRLPRFVSHLYAMIVVYFGWVLFRCESLGNLGTMIRTADAAGISGIVLLAGCTDIFAPKAVRSTMGSLLHIPVAEGICEADFISWARKNGYEITVTCLENADSLYQTDLQGR